MSNQIIIITYISNWKYIKSVIDDRKLNSYSINKSNPNISYIEQER